MKSRIGILLAALLLGSTSTVLAAELPPSPPAPPAQPGQGPTPPKVSPDEIAAAADAWRALQELGTAQASLFLTVKQVRATGLPSVLVHRWRRVFTNASGVGVLPPEDIAKVMFIRRAIRVLGTFAGLARADTARALARFSEKPQFFGLFKQTREGIEDALKHVRAIAEGREKFEAGAIRTRVLARKDAFAEALDKFRKWAEPFDLNAVRGAFYEALMFINEEEPRTQP